MASAVQGLMRAREARRGRQDRDRQLAMQLAARGGGQVLGLAGRLGGAGIRGAATEAAAETRAEAAQKQLEATLAANQPLREAQARLSKLEADRLEAEGADPVAAAVKKALVDESVGLATELSPYERQGYTPKPVREMTPQEMAMTDAALQMMGKGQVATTPGEFVREVRNLAQELGSADITAELVRGLSAKELLDLYRQPIEVADVTPEQQRIWAQYLLSLAGAELPAVPPEQLPEAFGSVPVPPGLLEDEVINEIIGRVDTQKAALERDLEYERTMPSTGGEPGSPFVPVESDSMSEAERRELTARLLDARRQERQALRAALLELYRTSQLAP